MVKAPRTSKVLLVDKTEGRVTRLTHRNAERITAWIPGAEYREQVSSSGKVSKERIMVPVHGSKKIRAAYFDDWILKTEKGFEVVKFDDSADTFFFVDHHASGPAMRRAHTRWRKLVAANAEV